LGIFSKIDKIIAAVIIVSAVLFVGYVYEYSTGLSILTGEKKTSGVGSDKWTETSETTQQQTTNCDPSYPDVCIPTYPPDLDCLEIQYENFKVLPLDPHVLDGDKDGIGCES